MSLDHLQAFFSEDNTEVVQVDDKLDTKSVGAILTGSIAREKKSIERYNEIGENIKKSERLRAKITKGVRAGTPIDDLLLIAIECIGVMTGDTVFIKQNIERLESRA